MRSRRAAVFLDRDGALRHGYWHRGNQFMIGDRETDMECGRRAGVGAALLSAGSLDDCRTASCNQNEAVSEASGKSRKPG